MKLTPEVVNTLKSYVYLYIDPRDEEIFYIGKGKGKRFLEHLEDKSKTPKTAKIAEIRQFGQEPKIDFLRYGLSDADAALVEAAAIELIGLSRLTNKVLGSHQGSFGLVSSTELMLKLTSEKTGVRDISSMVSAITSGVYIFDLKRSCDGYIYFATFSHCYRKVEAYREIRKPSLVKIEKTYNILKNSGYFSNKNFWQHDLVIGNAEEYQRWLERKGWGFVTRQYLENHLPEWLNPRRCFSSSQGVFIDIELISCLSSNLDIPTEAISQVKSPFSDLMQTCCKI
jgi:hypothetical protein